MPKPKRKIRAEFRQCRVIGHVWRYTTAERRGTDYEQGLLCQHCGTERFFRINARTGEAKGSRYAYPEGYLLEEGGALTPQERSNLRLIEIKTHSRSA